MKTGLQTLLEIHPLPWQFNMIHLQVVDANNHEVISLEDRLEDYQSDDEDAATDQDTAEALGYLVASVHDLRRELQHLVNCLQPHEYQGTLAIPGLATLNGARKALRKSEEEGHP